MPRLAHIGADFSYKGAAFLAWVLERFAWTLEIVQCVIPIDTFEVLRGGWIARRIFGWLNYYWGLSKDYEHQQVSSEGLIWVVLINLMYRRLAQQRAEQRLEKRQTEGLALQQASQ